MLHATCQAAVRGSVVLFYVLGGFMKEYENSCGDHIHSAVFGFVPVTAISHFLEIQCRNSSQKVV